MYDGSDADSIYSRDDHGQITGAGGGVGDNGRGVIGGGGNDRKKTAARGGASPAKSPKKNADGPNYNTEKGKLYNVGAGVWGTLRGVPKRIDEVIKKLKGSLGAVNATIMASFQALRFFGRIAGNAVKGFFTGKHPSGQPKNLKEALEQTKKEYDRVYAEEMAKLAKANEDIEKNLGSSNSEKTSLLSDPGNMGQSPPPAQYAAHNLPPQPEMTGAAAGVSPLTELVRQGIVPPNPGQDPSNQGQNLPGGPAAGVSAAIAAARERREQLGRNGAEVTPSAGHGQEFGVEPQNTPGHGGADRGNNRNSESRLGDILRGGEVGGIDVPQPNRNSRSPGAHGALRRVPSVVDVSSSTPGKIGTSGPSSAIVGNNRGDRGVQGDRGAQSNGR